MMQRSKPGTNHQYGKCARPGMCASTRGIRSKFELTNGNVTSGGSIAGSRLELRDWLLCPFPQEPMRPLCVESAFATTRLPFQNSLNRFSSYVFHIANSA